MAAIVPVKIWLEASEGFLSTDDGTTQVLSTRWGMTNTLATPPAFVNVYTSTTPSHYGDQASWDVNYAAAQTEFDILYGADAPASYPANPISGLP